MSNELLKYLKFEDINRDKWENSITKSPLNRIYAMPWYLDITSEVWDALVWGDYEYVMPLPQRSKMGINYFYQPTFCQQLGIFPTAPFNIQKEFATELQKNARFIQISVNSEINIDGFENFEINKRTNQTLHLDRAYSEIKAGFSNNTKRNINKAIKQGVQVIQGLTPYDFVENKKKLVEAEVESSSFKTLSQIITSSYAKGLGFIYAAYNEINELCAAAFFIRFNNRIIYLNAFSTEEGKENRAMFVIVDQVIKEYAGRNMILDFEGSEIDGVARFYKGFGALDETYYHLYLNRLPFPINLFKKNKT